jgi:large conductance mechanosensitive channel
MTPAWTSRASLIPQEAAMAAPISQKKGLIQEFKEFLAAGDVVTVAIGLVMALYVKHIVDAILEGVIFPIISAIFGKSNYDDIGFDVGDARVSIGLVINAIITFVVVGFLLFLLLKAYNAFRRKQPIATSPDANVAVLLEIRDELRRRG